MRPGFGILEAFMRSRFRCSSQQLLALTVVSFVGTVSLAMGQTPKDVGPADVLSEASEIDPKQIRGTSTKMLRSASELAQTAVSLSSQVSVASEGEPEGSDTWVRKVSSATSAFRTKLEENAEHLEVLEERLGISTSEQPPLLSGTNPKTDAGQAAASDVSRNDLAVALALAKETVKIEVSAKKTEASLRAAAEAEADALAEQVVAANEQIVQLQAAHDEVQAKSTDIEGELVRTRKNLDDLDKEYVVLESSFRDCRQDFDNCNQEKATLDPSNLSGKLKTTEDQLAELLALRDDLSVQVQDATSTAEQCASILRRSDDRLTPALTEIERLDAALAAERRKNEALTAELAAKQ